MSPRPLRIGVQLPEVERSVGWAEVRDIALTAEDVGFDSLWVGDHLLYRDGELSTGPWEAWSMLAGLAEATDRVQIGPLVAATAFHSPAMIAKKAATIDEMSGGRLVLGLGAGWNRTEFDAYGFPFDHRASRFEEAFTIVHALLVDGHIDFEGRFYTLRDCELAPPARPGGPPLMVGSHGPRVLRATLPHVDMWNGWYAWFGNTTDGAADLGVLVDGILDDVGRPRDDVERSVTVLVEAPGAMGNAVRAQRWSDPPAVTGAPEDIAAALARYATIGISELQLVVDPITAEAVEWLGQALDILDG